VPLEETQQRRFWSRLPAWVFVTFVALALLAAGALTDRYLGTSRPRLSLDRLSPEDRQRLVEQVGRESPGAFQPAWFEPRELAALELYFDRLRPDAVVLCLTHNDIDSSATVTPAGVLARSRARSDDFGDPLSYRYWLPLLDAPSFERRWRRAFSEVARTESELRQRRVPFFVYFAATWEEALAHSLVAGSGLRSPYAITPPELTLGRWRNPPPLRHGTPEANGRYARLVYGLMARDLGWPALEGAEAKSDETRIFRSPPSSRWGGRKEVAARKASESLRTSYVPGPSAGPQCLAAMDCESGLAPRATSFLLRRQPGASDLVLTLSRLSDPSWIYPLPFETVVTDEKEEVRASFVLRADGPADSRHVLRLPRGRSAAIEVTLLAARETAGAQVLSGRAYRVRRIEQVERAVREWPPDRERSGIEPER
jgi:hypothetical protein